MAQTSEQGLSDDPVFTTILKRRIKYPRDAEWVGKYMRVFAEFTVGDKGRVQNITILNQSPTGAHLGFEYTVATALKKLPSLNLRYTGSYILPVSFIYVDYRQKDKPYVPTDTLFIDDLRGRVILKEINVFGSSVNSRERVLAADDNRAY
ncbi:MULTISPECIES: hypothetical protein [unclassified Spirosoma]|uniref:hypothetical protein n=1 Tax=unclassified Spirosoma TaxID=2621999 RepID=UPI0025DF7036|nr:MULTISPECIES: hypothetical protein [unclassified Spirosoma]